MYSRVTAGLSAVSALAGMLVLGRALYLEPSLRFDGYISELAGSDGPAGVLYQAGLWFVALATILLALALRAEARLAALALAGIAPLVLVTSVVPCTEGCPLPPYESTTVQDLAHGIAIVAAFVLALVSMYFLRASHNAWLRRFSEWALWSGGGAVSVAGLAQLAFGRSLPVGVSERGLVTLLLAWLVSAGVLRALQPHSRRERAPGAAGHAPHATEMTFPERTDPPEPPASFPTNDGSGGRGHRRDD